MTLFGRLTFLTVLLLGCPGAIAGGVTTFGDVLVWHASQQTSSVWASSISTSGSPASFSAENVDFGWDAGFRVGFLHDPGERAWDTKLSWTHWRNRATASLAPSHALIIPEFFSAFVNVDDGIVDRAAIDWNLTFNTVDFELGHAIAVSDAVSIRPAMGLRAAIIQQRIRADFDSTSSSLSVTERVKHDFRGFGPTFAIDGRWRFPRTRNLSAVGQFSGGLLWGVWNVDDTYERNDSGFSLPAYGGFTTSIKDSHLGTVNLNCFLGLEWVREGTFTVTGRVGYELQWWANQQRLPAFEQLPLHGDLTIQGLTCGISVGF